MDNLISWYKEAKGDSDSLSVLVQSLAVSPWGNVFLEDGEEVFGIICGTEEFIDSFDNAPICGYGTETPVDLNDSNLVEQYLQKSLGREAFLKYCQTENPVLRALLAALESGWTVCHVTPDGLIVGTPEYLAAKLQSV